MRSIIGWTACAALLLGAAHGPHKPKGTPDAGTAAAEHVVKISLMKFVPDNLTVKVGESVTWKNEDIVQHTVFAAPDLVSPVINPGQSWTWKATKAGPVAYGCTLHPVMKANLTVE